MGKVRLFYAHLYTRVWKFYTVNTIMYNSKAEANIVPHIYIFTAFTLTTLHHGSKTGCSSECAGVYFQNLQEVTWKHKISVKEVKAICKCVW